MSRPTKAGIDYFPLDVTMDEKIELVEAKHGLSGFALIIKLYQQIYRNGYYFKIDSDQILLLKKKTGLDVDTVESIINDAVSWGVFNKKLYKKYSVITSAGIQSRYIEAIKRRKKASFIKEYLLINNVSDLRKSRVFVEVTSLTSNDGPPQEVPPGDAGKKKTPESGIKKKLLKELKKQIALHEALKPHESMISTFFNYRMSLNKKDQYQTEHGIKGLIRECLRCQVVYSDLNECLEVSMGRGWLTPDPEYLKGKVSTLEESGGDGGEPF